MNRLRPPFTYFGAKQKLAGRIIDWMPPHDVYLEPYFGSGAVLFSKAPVRHEIINDIFGAIPNFYRVLRDRPEDLERVCRLSPYSRSEWEACFDVTGDGIDELEWARRWWVRVGQSFAKTGSHRTGWSRTTARTQSPPASMQSRIDRFSACAARLANVTIECGDAIALVDKMATARTVCYLDPPYVAEARSNRAADDYAQETDDDHHRRLADVLAVTPAKVILSGYPSRLYDELYRDWERREVTVTVTSTNAVTHPRRGQTEVFWMNFTPIDPEPRLWEEPAS